MRRIRFAALASASFLVALFGAVLIPGTWVNRALATAMCAVISFDSTACMANLGKNFLFSAHLKRLNLDFMKLFYD